MTTTQQVGAVAFAGRAGWHRTRPTSAEHADQVRMFIWQEANGRTLTADANPEHADNTIIAAVRARFPDAVERYGRAALLAVARGKGPGVCDWCAAFTAAGADAGEGPDMYDAEVWRLLGKPCRGCYQRQREQHQRLTPEGQRAAMDRYRRSKRP